MNPGIFSSNGSTSPSGFTKYTGRNWGVSAAPPTSLVLPAFESILGNGYGQFGYTTGVRTLVARATGKGILRFAGIATNTATSGTMTCELWVDGKLTQLASGLSSSGGYPWTGYMLAGQLRYGVNNTDPTTVSSAAAPLIYAPDNIPFNSSVELYFTGATPATGYRAFCVDFYE